jgi:cytochrome c oxidase assembly protein subunit 15
VRPSPWLHRYAICVAAATLFLLIAGGLVTSNEAGLSVPDWPLSYGKVMPEMTGGIFYEHGHRMVASTVGLMTIVLAVWLWRADERAWMRRLGFAALAAVIVQGALGGVTVLFLLPKPVSISHACLAQLFFSTTVAIALFTSPAWREGPRAVMDHPGPPGLRWMGYAVPGVLLAQIALGAAYRHKALDLVPHVLGGVLAAAVVLSAAYHVLTRFADHQPLRRSAIVMVAMTMAQVFLGIGAYMARVATAGAPQPMPSMVMLTVAHVAMGGLALASGVVFGIQVARHVRPARYAVI